MSRLDKIMTKVPVLTEKMLWNAIAFNYSALNLSA